jgi:hypothetical protein
MRSPLRLLALTLVVTLAAVGSAQAVIISAGFSPTPFTKATTGPGNVVSATFNWSPPTFSPTAPMDKQDIESTDLTVGGSSGPSVLGPAAFTANLLLINGHQYRIRLSACTSNASCVSLPAPQFVDVTADTRIDATPPSGTVQINDGAVATNSRNVTLNLEASDPLIDGIAGSSSGVTQARVDVDGNGTFPCSFTFNDPNSDFSGCAAAFNPATPATLPAGDGIKTVGVVFGDGARAVPVPSSCPPVCTILLGSPILGNQSAVATDTILLDTVKPTAVVKQDRTTVNVGDLVNFDASTSADQASTATSGIDLPTAAWQWKDGTPNTNGAKVSHVFNQSGTFVGELRVKDRAGNTSDPRSFTVTVNAPGGAASGGSSISGLTGKAGFKLNRLKVNARFVKGRLKGSIRLRGSIVISGSSTKKGALRADLRRTPKGRLLARIRTRKLKVGPFTRTLKLPANLQPGGYKLAFVGPGGTLRFTLKLTR